MSRTRLILSLAASGIMLAAAVLFLVVSLTRPNWKEFASPEGRFSVLMVGPPQEENVNAVHRYRCQPRKDVVYTVTYLDVPDDALKKDAPNYKNVFLVKAAKILESPENYNGTVRQDAKPLLLGEHPGLEVEMEAANQVHFLVRLYLVNNRYYQVTAQGPADAIHSPEASRFLDSFKLTS
jgi:hypothetical protein